MPHLRSKVNAHGRTTIPASIRRKLGVGSGSIVEWHHDGDAIVIRKAAGPYAFEDIRRALFPKRPRAHSLEELKEGIADYIRDKHGRR
jgi:AbrB family looped-hinge helix DNA binding protein